ncbi:MAG: hypothetical protein FWB86_02945 [Treponema sp.]|nr:hypothetical protein [Treponema sp.]MCL2252237.1 hypothetical protein [Treponema sp.]
MPAAFLLFSLLLFISGINIYPQSFRTIVEGSVEITSERISETPVTISTNGSVIINIGTDPRFLRGVELEISAPAAWVQPRFRNMLIMSICNDLYPKSASGITDFTSRQLATAPLPSRLSIIYHIPVRTNHGLRNTTSVIVPTAIIQPESFPILFNLRPIDKGLPPEVENMTFNVTARAIFSDEGAVRLEPRYPPQLRNRPFTVLINDNVITNILEDIILREGENHLVIISENYRNESRRFIVERGKIIDLIIELQDPAPIIIFEGPQNAQIFFDNVPIVQNREPIIAEPGSHEIKYQIGDYTIIRSINVQRGKTYRIALDVNLNIIEED